MKNKKIENILTFLFVFGAFATVMILPAVVLGYIFASLFANPHLLYKTVYTVSVGAG
jgi:hypothetical protein